jgi:hypothetical protein
MFDAFLLVTAVFLASIVGISLLRWRELVPITRLQDPPKSQFGLIRIAKHKTADDEPLQQKSRTSTTGNGASPILTVIWVHGLGSNPDTTWLGSTPRDGQDPRDTLPPRFPVNWIEDLLFPDLVASSESAIEMFHYNYESYWLRDSVQQRLPRMAEDMLLHISNYLGQHTHVEIPWLVVLFTETLTFLSQERNENSYL